MDCQPVIPSIHGSLSSSLRSTFVVQLTTMLLHNNSRHARHPVPHFVGALKLSSLLLEGLPKLSFHQITFLVILTIYIRYKRTNKCSLRDLDLFLDIFLYPVSYCFLLLHSLVQLDKSLKTIIKNN